MNNNEKKEMIITNANALEVGDNQGNNCNKETTIIYNNILKKKMAIIRNNR